MFWTYVVDLDIIRIGPTERGEKQKQNVGQFKQNKQEEKIFKKYFKIVLTNKNRNVNINTTKQTT